MVHLSEFLNHFRRGGEPDSLFVRTENLDRLRSTYLDGPADLVIEIVSPESVARDRGDRFVEYEQAELYQLGDNGRYRQVLGGSDGEYRSHVLSDFRLTIAWLWQDPLPKVSEILGTLGIH